MTEEEHIELVRRGDLFWREFSALCNRYIRETPEHLRGEAMYHFGDKTSIFGRDENA